jgi:hypothetical protein
LTLEKSNVCGETMAKAEPGAYEGETNEALGRKINDLIRRRVGPEPDNKIRVVCECADSDCDELIELTVRQYEYLRRNDSRFVVIVGHESRSLERIVGGEGPWLIVQKTREARRYVEEMDGS